MTTKFMLKRWDPDFKCFFPVKPKSNRRNNKVNTLTQQQIDAIERAIACLDEVRTGSDFEVECWDAARGLRKELLGKDEE